MNMVKHDVTISISLDQVEYNPEEILDALLELLHEEFDVRNATGEIAVIGTDADKDTSKH